MMALAWFLAQSKHSVHPGNSAVVLVIPMLGLDLHTQAGVLRIFGACRGAGLLLWVSEEMRVTRLQTNYLTTEAPRWEIHLASGLSCLFP